VKFDSNLISNLKQNVGCLEKKKIRKSVYKKVY
jgi:hypothetical protein